MKLPEELNLAIQEKVENVSLATLRKTAKELSNRYQTEERKGQSLLQTPIEAITYAIMRMPATFGAVATAAQYTFKQYTGKLRTMIDVGAGTGSATWAMNKLQQWEKITCLEREEEMYQLGKELMQYCSGHEMITWEKIDITCKESIEKQADLVVASYIFNEIDDRKKEEVWQKLKNMTSKVLLIVEPGTPESFHNIKRMQQEAINSGWKIIAPCTMQNTCPLPEDDWCHATVRIERNKIHKYIKEADLPYEDEKFCYLAITKEDITTAKARILRHPYIESGKVTVKLCENGEIVEKIITKKEKERFKTIKKMNCGDCIE